MNVLITGLYVPGDRPDRFDKAVATGADLVILDLEDAVAQNRKAHARDAVATWLAAAHVDCVLQVRVNTGDDDDLAAHPAVTRLGLGEADLASELGTRTDAVLDHARVRLLYATRAAGLPAPMLSVYPAIRDLAGLRADTERGKRWAGWGGWPFTRHNGRSSRRCSARRRRNAAGPRKCWQPARTGVSTLASGEMVDPAMLGRARAILARAERKVAHRT